MKKKYTPENSFYLRTKPHVHTALRRLYQIIAVLWMMLWVPTTLEASHIAGGEITYECLGGNQYRVQYIFFRDCGGVSLPSAVTIQVYDAGGTLVQSPSLSLDSTTQLNGTAPTPCTVIPNGVCLDIGIYSAIVTLPPIPGGYTLTFDNCCRNAGIVNGSALGAAYFATVPDAALATCNNRAIFNDWPPVFICRGDTFSFDHSAIDPDGDSLVYSLCTPYESYPGTPYQFLPGFSAANPMGGTTPLTIDPVTGMMTAVPPNVGKYVVGVCVSEYRNGVLITTSSRDFQLNVVNCQEVTVASAISAATNCVTREVSFFNNSTGASTYLWDFGDGNGSTATNPVHNYPSYGTYNVTLISYNGGNPQCNDTATTIIALVDTCQPCGMSVSVTTFEGICNALDGCAEIVWTHPCGTSQSVSYSGSSSSGNCGSTISFSGGAAPTIDNVSITVDGVTLPSPATTETITILGPASPCGGSFSSSSSGGNITYTFNAVYTEPQTGGAYATVTGGTPPYNIQWVTTPTQTGDTAFAVEPGNYNVIVTDANGCVEVVQFVIAGSSNMTVTASGTDITSCGANDGTLDVVVSGNTGTLSYLWTPGGYTTASVANVPPGFYTVQVTDDSCSTTDTVTVHDAANVQVTINTTDITCPTDSNGAASVQTTTGGTGPYTYHWTTSPAQTTAAVSNLPFGFYTVIATDQNGCTGQQSFGITGPPAMTTSMSSTGLSCANANDGTATIAVAGGTAPYNITWNSNPAQNGPTATALPGGVSYFTAVVTDDNGCEIRDSIQVATPLSIQIDLEDLSEITCAGVFTGSIGATISGGQPNLVDETILYNEGFNTDDLEIECDRWFTDVSSGGTNTIMDPSDYFRVINNQFAGQDLDGEGVWLSRIIDISAEANVTISGDFFECGAMEAGDYIRAFYKINGGPEILWFNQTDDGAVDCSINSPSLGGLVGNDLQIIVRMFNGSNEIHRFDNINVNGNVSGVLYNEPFNTNDLWNDPDCNWQRDVTAVTTTDITGAGTADHVETRNGVLEFQDVDGEIVWYSTLIDISSCSEVDVSMDFNVTGFMSSTEYIRGYYAIDGGAEVLWIDHTDDNAAGWPNGIPSTDVISGLSGNTLRLIVRVFNSGSTDIHSIDNVIVTCKSPSPNPYDLSWSCTAATSDTITGLPPGTCTLTATDSAGCSTNSSMTLVDPGVITATASATDACGGTNNGTATANPSGGNPPYTYAWSCSAATSQAVVGLAGGSNCTITVTDSDGCSVTPSVTVGTSPSFDLDTIVNHGTCSNDGSIDLLVTGGTAAFIYSWNTGATTEDITGLNPNNTFTVAVWDANLCFENMSVRIDSSGCILLPTNLLSFRGEKIGKSNQLYWETETEIDNDYFVLERSADAINWTNLGTVNGAGTSNVHQQYTYTDVQPFEKSYYRLKMVKSDGTTSRSNVIVLRRNQSTDWGVLIYPNPADKDLTIEFSNGVLEDGATAIKFYDVLGKLVSQQKIVLSNNNRILNLDTKTLVNGVYFIAIQQGIYQHSEKIIIRH